MADRERPDSKDAEHRTTATRRRCLKVAGLTTASLAGLSNGAAAESTTAETSDEVTGFGFGGSPRLTVPTQAQLTFQSESEPNDTMTDATVIETNTTVTGPLTPGDTDWFAFEAADEEISIEYTRPTDVGITVVVLFDADGYIVDHQFTTGPQTVSLSQTTTAGTYFVQIVNVEGGDGEYTVTVRGDSTESTYGVQGYGEYGYGGITA